MDLIILNDLKVDFKVTCNNQQLDGDLLKREAVKHAKKVFLRVSKNKQVTKEEFDYFHVVHLKPFFD